MKEFTPKPWHYLRIALRTRGISRKELADILGVSPDTVDRWIYGYSNPRVQTFIELAELLNIRLDKLIYRCPFLVDPKKEDWMDDQPGWNADLNQTAR